MHRQTPGATRPRPRATAWLRGALPFLLVPVLVLSACGGSDDQAAAGGPDTGRPEAGAVARHTVTFTDDSGREVSIEAPVQKVAVFNTFNVEFVRAVGEMDTVVAIDEGAAKVPEYWDGFATTAGKGQAEPDLEKLAALQPEVVIFPRNGAYEAARTKLEPFGIDVVVITGWDQDQHVANLERVGQMFDRPDEARKLIDFYEQWKGELTTRLAGVEPAPVYLENEAELTSPVPGSGWHQMVELAGGRNIFEDVSFGDQPPGQGSVHAFPIESEAVVARSPQLVVKLNGGQYRVPEPGALDTLRTTVMGRPGWSAIPAVQQGHVVATSSFPMNASSKIIGSLYLASWLHPEAMTGVDPDAVMTEWIEQFQGVPYEEPTAYYTALGS